MAGALWQNGGAEAWHVDRRSLDAIPSVLRLRSLSLATGAKEPQDGHEDKGDQA
jgi:hypothetical protein